MSTRPSARDVGTLAAAGVLALPVLVGIGHATLVSLGVSGVGTEGLTMERIARVLGERATWRGTAWTFWTAGAGTALGTMAAVVVAVAFRGTRPGDRVARSLAVSPLPIPHLVAGAAALLVLGQSGLLARMAYAAGLIDAPGGMPALVYDPWGIALVLTFAWKEFPFLAVVAFAVLAARGAEAEEAARTLGASSAETFRRVTWPLLWRGLAPAVVAVFIFLVGHYEAAALLAPSDPLALPLLTYERHQDADLSLRADAYVLTLVALGIGLAAVVLHEWLRARREPLA